MQEIYFLRDGEDAKKISRNYSIECIDSENKLFGNRYVISQNGTDDIYFVRNYYPLYEYTIKPNEKIIDIMAMGYNVNDYGESEGDNIILSKPSAYRHIVQPMETIQMIANKYGVSEKDIISINHLQTSKLFIGQILWI